MNPQTEASMKNSPRRPSTPLRCRACDLAVYWPALNGAARDSASRSKFDIEAPLATYLNGQPIAGEVGRSMRFRVASVQRVVAAVLAALLLLPASAAPSSTSKSGAKPKSPGGSRLEGRIEGPDGKPVRGAVVVVRALEGEKSWASEPSDRGGKFS